MAYSRRCVERRRGFDEETVIFDKSSVKRYGENVQSRFHSYQARRYQEESNNNSWERYSENPGNNSGRIRDPRISPPVCDSYIVPVRSEGFSRTGNSYTISSSDAAQRDFDIHVGRLHDSSRDVNHFRNKQYNCNEVQLHRNQENETSNQGQSPSISESPNFEVESSDVSNERNFRYGLIQWTDCKYAKMKINKNCVKRAPGLSKLLSSNKSSILKGCWLKEIIPRNVATQVKKSQENIPKTTTNSSISDQRASSQGQQNATVIHSKFDNGTSEYIVSQEFQESQTLLNQLTENGKSENTTINNQYLNGEEEEGPVYPLSVGSLISALRKSVGNGNSKDSLTNDDTSAKTTPRNNNLGLHGIPQEGADINFNLKRDICSKVMHSGETNAKVTYKDTNPKETCKNHTNSMICKYDTSSKTSHKNNTNSNVTHKADTNPKVTHKADTTSKGTLKNHISSKESCKDNTSSMGSHIDDCNSKVSHKDGSDSKVTHKNYTNCKATHKIGTSIKATHKDDTSSKRIHRDDTSSIMTHKDDTSNKVTQKVCTISKLSHKDGTSSKGTCENYTSSKVTCKDDTRSKVPHEARTSSKVTHKNDTSAKTTRKDSTCSLVTKKRDKNTKVTHEGSTNLKVTDIDDKVTHIDTNSNVTHDDDRNSKVTDKGDTNFKYNTGTKVTHEGNISLKLKETQKDETSSNMIQDDINFNRIQEGNYDTSSKVTHQHGTGFKGTHKDGTHKDNEASSNIETTKEVTLQKDDNTCPKVSPLLNVDNGFKLKISRPRHVGTPKSKNATEVNSLPNCHTKTSTKRMADGDERNASNYVDNLDSENIDNIRETIRMLVNQKNNANETERNSMLSKGQMKQMICSKDRKIPADIRKEDLVKQTSNKGQFRKPLEDTKKKSENVGKADCSSADARERKQTESTEKLRGKDTELRENEKRKVQNSLNKEETNGNKKRKGNKDDACILEGNGAERASNRKERVKNIETIEKQHREKDDQSHKKKNKEKMADKEEISVRNMEEECEKAKKTKEKNCLKNNEQTTKDQKESKRVNGSIQEEVIIKHTDLGKSHKRNILKPIEKKLEMNILKTVIKKIQNEKREEKNSEKVNNKSLKDRNKVNTSSHCDIRDRETSDEIAQRIHKNSDSKSCESGKSLDMNIQENKRKYENDHIHGNPRTKKNKLDETISSNEVTVNVSNIAVNQGSSDHSAVVSDRDTSQSKELAISNEDEAIHYEAVEIKQEYVNAVKSEFEESDEPLCEICVKAEPLWEVYVKPEPVETIEESSGTADYDKKRELELYLGEWMKIWEVKKNLFDDFYDMLVQLDKPVWRIETHSVLYNIEVNMRRFFLDVYCNLFWDKAAVCNSMQQFPKLAEFFSLFESIDAV